jgi:Lon protease-like protein
MSNLLPIFPLQLVLFPGEVLHLHIFEPRYRQLIQECDEGSIQFGIPTVLNGQLASVGTTAKLKDIIQKYPDGRMDIAVVGDQKFEIKSLLRPMEGKLYDGAMVHWLGDDTVGEKAKQFKMHRLIKEIYRALQLTKPGLTDNSLLNTYEVAHFIGLSIQQEYELLALPSETARQDFIIQFLEKVMPTMESLDRLKERVAMNGHFKEFRSPDY